MEEGKKEVVRLGLGDESEGKRAEKRLREWTRRARQRDQKRGVEGDRNGNIKRVQTTDRR